MAKKYIIIHHSVSPDHPVLKNFDEIKRWHVENNGYRDIGYHWVVEYINGKLTAIPGRAEWDTGAHTIGRNNDGIGICIVGNFEKDTPTEELYQFVANLCKEIKCRHPITEIDGHRDHNATACPGKNFNMDRVRELMKDDRKPILIKINIKGKEFDGYLKGGTTYFDEACKTPVRAVVEAISPNISWESETTTVFIR